MGACGGSSAAADGAYWVNFGAEPLALPDGASVLLASAELVAGLLPPDAAAWLQLA